MEKWSYYTENNFVRDVEIESQLGDFILYEAFSSLDWKHIFCIAYKDDILVKEYDSMDIYTIWSGIEMAYKRLSKGE